MLSLLSKLSDLAIVGEKLNSLFGNRHNNLESLRENWWSDQLHFDDFLGHFLELLIGEKNVEVLFLLLSSLGPFFLWGFSWSQGCFCYGVFRLFLSHAWLLSHLFNFINLFLFINARNKKSVFEWKLQKMRKWAKRHRIRTDRWWWWRTRFVSRLAKWKNSHSFIWNALSWT